jgi:hypothetical protein
MYDHEVDMKVREEASTRARAHQYPSQMCFRGFSEMLPRSWPCVDHVFGRHGLLILGSMWSTLPNGKICLKQADDLYKKQETILHEALADK